MLPYDETNRIPIPIRVRRDKMDKMIQERGWNPLTPYSFSSSEEKSPQYQSGSPASHAHKAPTPGSGGGNQSQGSGLANTPGGNRSEAGKPGDSSTYANEPSLYLPSTQHGQPMTPNSASYVSGTPGGQPMAPGTGGLDAIGTDNEGPWFMPDILVKVRRTGEDCGEGVIREVLLDGSCRVDLGCNGNGGTITALSTEMEIVPPRKADKIKITGGAQRGATGKLLGVDGTDGIVKVSDTLDVHVLDMAILAKLA